MSCVLLPSFGRNTCSESYPEGKFLWPLKCISTHTNVSRSLLGPFILQSCCTVYSAARKAVPGDACGESTTAPTNMANVCVRRKQPGVRDVLRLSARRSCAYKVPGIVGLRSSSSLLFVNNKKNHGECHVGSAVFLQIHTESLNVYLARAVCFKVAQRRLHDSFCPLTPQAKSVPPKANQFLETSSALSFELTTSMDISNRK